MKKTMMLLIVVLTLLCSSVFASATTTPSTDQGPVTIISPDSTENIDLGDGVLIPYLKTDNLTVSVKVTDGSTYNISVFKQKLEQNVSFELIERETLVDMETYTGTGTLSYYTRSITEGVDPDCVYTVEVKAPNATEAAAVKRVYVEAPEAANTDIFTNTSPSPAQWIQNLLKSIFN